MLLLTSCRTEDTEFTQATNDQNLMPNSLLVNLMQATAMNDGSIDNILDKANCFSIQLPITVLANGTEIILNNEDDLNAVEFIFDTTDDDTDTLEIIFPISIVLSDFTEVEIQNNNELINYASQCNGENEMDSDIECLDFEYPILATVFSSSQEIIETLTLNNDRDLYEFLHNIDENDIINIEFPITVYLFDGTEITLYNLSELKEAIEIYGNDCDEDDDFNFNDDDCNQCTQEELISFLTNCNGWEIDQLERNKNDYDNYYDGYYFNFYEDGTIYVYWSGIEALGTWTVSGSGNNMTVVIDIPQLPYCNNNWTLHEIQTYSGETRVDLRVGNDDRLRYFNFCY
ncbi:hypothetical protein GCM10022260_11820 [Gaetbulibacter aestuarii]